MMYASNMLQFYWPIMSQKTGKNSTMRTKNIYINKPILKNNVH